MAEPFTWANMPTDILREILSMAVKIMEKDREESVDRLLDEDLDSDGEVKNSLTPSDQFTLAPDHSVKFLLSWATVSKHWAKLISDEMFWRSLPYNDFLRLLPDPWEYPKWKGIFENKSVVLSCLPSKLVETFGKVHLSRKCGHSRFTVVLPFTIDARIRNFEAWDQVRSAIIDTCRHLTFDAMVIREGDERREDTDEEDSSTEDDNDDVQNGRLISIERSVCAGARSSRNISPQPSEWSLLPDIFEKLESLDLAGRVDGRELKNAACLAHIWQRCVRPQLNSNIPGRRKSPSFPALKSLRLADHPYGHFSREMIDAAPNLERCEIITAGYRKGPLDGWDMHRNSIAHRRFLDSELLFRTYVTPYFMLAYKHPGPKKFGNRCEFESLDQVSHTPGYGILVSEKKSGTLCEVRLSLGEFFDVDDLRCLNIPEHKQKFSI